MKFIWTSLFIFSFTIINAQAISTFAGGGSGAGIQATNFCFNQPLKVSGDKQGNLYVCLQHVIRKINTSGVISIVAGSETQGYSGDGGPASAAKLNLPSDVVIDPNGNIFIADAGNNVIRKINTAGIISTYAGIGVGGFSGDGGQAVNAWLRNPSGLALDSIGNLYVVDQANNRIRKIDNAGIINTIAGNGSTGYTGDGGPATAATFWGPDKICIDRYGNIFLSETANNCIRKINTSGIITTYAGTGTAGYNNDGIAATTAQLTSPQGISADHLGNLYIVDDGNRRIRRVDNSGIITTIGGNGTIGFSGDGGPAINSQIWAGSKGIFSDSVGNTFFCDQNRIRNINASTGIINTIAGNGSNFFGGDGSAANLSQLSACDMAVDKFGNVYIADIGNSRIRKVNTSGIITTIAGTGTPGYNGDGGLAVNAKINQPSCIAVDSSGNIYFGDNYNWRLRKIDASGTVTTIAGTGTQGYSGDGGAATGAMIGELRDITFDTLGNLYFSDYGNSRIRKINSTGIISTVAGNGTWSYGGDGGPATSAALNYPTGIAFDKNQNLFIADANNNIIRRINNSGVISTYAGQPMNSGSSGDGGQAYACYLSSPQGLVFDKNWNLLISDNNSVVRKISPTGVITRYAGIYNQQGYNGDGILATSAKLNGSQGLCIDDTNNIYIADNYNHRIRKVTPPLVISINSATICPGVTTTLTASGATTYTWSTGATTPSITVNPSFTTNYTVTGQSGQSMGTKTVNVNVYTVNTLSVTGVTSICLGDSSALHANSTNGVTYSWAPATGLNVTNNKNVISKPTANVTYTVTVIDNHGCSINTTVPVTIVSSPTISIAGSSTVCTGDSTTLSVSSFGACQTPTYSWTPSTGLNNTTGVSVIAKPTVNTVYTVTAIAASYTTSATFSVSITSPVNTLSVTATSPTICAGSSTQLIASGSNTYTWSTSSTSPTITVSPGTTTTYTVRSTNTGVTCTNIGYITITVLPAPPVTVNSPAACYGDSVVLIANGASTYTWSTGSNSNSIKVISNGGSSYTVTGTGSNGCIKKATSIVTTHWPPSTSVNSGYICNGNSITLTGTGASSYTWSTGQTSPSIVVSPTVTTTYTITGDNATHDCINSAVATVTVSACLGDTNIGIIQQVAGNSNCIFGGDGGQALLASFKNPQGLAFDSKGNLFVADYNNNRVRKIDTNNVVTTYAGVGNGLCAGDGGPATSAKFGSPIALVFDANDNLYFTEGWGQIRKIDSTGIISTVAGQCQNNGYSGDNGLAINAQMYGPKGLAIDASGNLYVADMFNHRIRKISTSGIITTYAGTGTNGHTGDGSSALTAEISFPNELAIDATGNLYFSEYGTYTIRMISSSGIISTIAGTGTAGYSGDGNLATNAQFNYPNYLCLDGKGNLFVSDVLNNVIRAIDLSSGIIKTVVGNGTQGFTGNNGYSNLAELYYPSGLAFDANGDLFWSETDNCVIRKVGKCLPTLPTITMVSVDSLSQNNIVYWNYNFVDRANDTFYVYRDTANYNFALIGKIQATAPSMFIDTLRALYPSNGNPNASSWKYAISYQDSCGVFSQFSPAHKTISLTYNNTGGFTWSHYQIQGQPTPLAQISNYNLEVDSSSTGHYSLVTSLSNTVLSCNDPSYNIYPNPSWRLAATGFSCTPNFMNTNGTTSNTGVNYINSYSNVIKAPHTTGISKQNNLSVQVYPIPASNSVNITTNSHATKNLFLYDSNGNMVHNQTIKESTIINTSVLQNGVYQLVLIDNKNVTNQKLIILK